jgi:hypothetical protein
LKHQKYNPSVPFEYQFVDEELKEVCTEELISKITNTAALAIFIAALGLLVSTVENVSGKLGYAKCWELLTQVLRLFP